MIKLAQPTFGISSDSQKYAYTLTSNPSRQTVLSFPTNIFSRCSLSPLRHSEQTWFYPPVKHKYIVYHFQVSKFPC